MKRSIIFIITAVLLLSFSSCSGSKDFESEIFNARLETEINNECRFNNAVYLTEDKFFFTTEDENSDNTFGNPTKLVAYNLLTGERDYPLDFFHGDIKKMTLAGTKLYFVTYTSTDADWGWCLFSLDINSYALERIYQAHNTVDEIYLSGIGDVIYYLCCADNNSYELHMIKNNSDIVIKDHIVCRYADMYAYNSNIYITIYEYSGLTDYYSIDSDGKLSEADSDSIPDYYEIAKRENISGKILSGKFGRYYILEDKVPEKNDTGDSCSYEYTIGYYLYDSQTKEKYNLCQADYWYYFI